MRLTAHQPNYLPYPGFFQKIARADEFLIVDTTQFVKRGTFGWIHRNRIRTPNGPIWLSLPVLHKGKYHQSILDAALNPRVDWRGKHWRSIEWNYRSARYWERYAPSLREIYRESWTHLAPLCTKLIRWFLAQLDLAPPVHVASALAARGESTEYIIAFCKELGASGFLSGVHGRDYLDRSRFEKEGIVLEFQDYEAPVYSPREGAEPLANLSMLDMLFHCGEGAARWVHSTKEVAAS
ncbi:MAG: WbqC family protein [Planctomycetes bacterium]|nr:WbqC family protein [Planctomycetota bacterium]